MNMKLYGICFKLRGGPDLLDHVQSNTAIPVELMGQVMEQVATVTPDELAFAGKLDSDWRRAFAEKVPLTMTVAEDGGYDITCSVPDELLETARLVTGLENEKIIEEYAAMHLKEICGIDADILSVDSIKEDMPAVAKAAPAQAVQGFDLSDLSENPESPALEDISELTGMDIPVPAVQDVQEAEPVKTPEPVKEAEPAKVPESVEEEPAEEPGFEEYDEEPAYEDEGAFGDEGIALEEGYPEGDGFFEEEAAADEVSVEEVPVEEEEAVEEDIPAEEDVQEDGEAQMQNAITGIYKDLVGNIKDRKLDERLGLKIGQ